MKTTLKNLLLIVGAAGLIVGCSKTDSGFSSKTGASLAPPTNPSGGNDNSGQGADGDENTSMPVAPDLDANVGEGLYKGTQTVSFDSQTGDLIVSMPLGLGVPLNLTSGSIQQVPGVTFYTTRDSGGNYFLVFRIPVKHLLRGVNGVQARTLPNGDPLSAYIPAGEASAFGLTFDASRNMKLYLYIASEAVAVYMEADWLTCGDLPICFGFNWPIKNKAKNKEVGRFAILMPRAGAKGGFLISTKLPEGASRALEGFIR